MRIPSRSQTSTSGGSGISQMQVQLVAKMKFNMSSGELSQLKEKNTERYNELLGKSADVFNHPEEAVDLLGKYISILKQDNPDLSAEQLIEDYARGLKRSRDQNSMMPDKLKDDIKRYQEFESTIDKALKNEE